MAEPKGSERRKFERIERKDEIQVKEFTYPERGRYQKARIKDLSGGGLQIETRHFFAPKTLLKIEMNFTGWQRYTRSFLKYFGDAATTRLVVLAEVVRCEAIVTGDRYDVAVVFSSIDESHREALLRFIRTEITARR